MKKRLESHLQEDVKKYLNENKIYFRRTYPGFISGLPDLEVFYKGHYIALETKKEDGTGKATLQQKRNIKIFKELGFIAEFITDLERVKSIIKEIDEGIVWKNRQ